MTPVFNTADTDTWPVLLSLEHVAEIWQRKPRGIAHSCQQGRFIPAPISKKPYRWRRVDVLRFLQDGRGSSLRRAS